MKSTDTYNDIKEVNLSYLMLAQNMVRSDREGAIFRLGISEENAALIALLSPAQMMRIASGNTLLCRFRMDDDMVWGLLTNHGKPKTRAIWRSRIHLALMPSIITAQWVSGG